MKPILQSIRATPVSKFISLYHAIFSVNNHEKEYDFVSRNLNITETNFSKPYTANAVTLFVFNKDKTKMLLIKEFRYPLNDYVISTPAGLIDNGEDIEEAALRELNEEVGYTPDQVTIDRMMLPSYSSVSISDEQTASIFVRVDDSLEPTPNLQDSEDIRYFWIDIEGAEYFLQYGKFPTWYSDNLNLNDENWNPRKVGITARTQLVLQQFVDTCKLRKTIERL